MQTQPPHAPTRRRLAGRLLAFLAAAGATLATLPALLPATSAAQPGDPAPPSGVHTYVWQTSFSTTESGFVRFTKAVPSGHYLATLSAQVDGASKVDVSCGLLVPASERVLLGDISVYDLKSSHTLATTRKLRLNHTGPLALGCWWPEPKTYETAPGQGLQLTLTRIDGLEERTLVPASRT